MQRFWSQLPVYEGSHHLVLRMEWASLSRDPAEGTENRILEWRGRENRCYSKEETVRWQIWEKVVTRRWRRWCSRMWEGVHSTKCFGQIENNFIVNSNHSRKEYDNPLTPLNLKEAVSCKLMNLYTISYTIFYIMLTGQQTEQNIHPCPIFSICRVLFTNHRQKKIV